MEKNKLWILGLLSILMVTAYACNNQAMGPSGSAMSQSGNAQMVKGKSPQSMNDNHMMNGGKMMGMMTSHNFVAHLNSRNEVFSMPVNSKGEGEAIFHVGKNGKMIHYKLIVSNIDNVFMAHIHWGASTKNGPIVVWLYPMNIPMKYMTLKQKVKYSLKNTVIKGRKDGVLAKGTITAKDLTGPFKNMPLWKLIKEMKAGSTYVQVHTLQHKKGEIRGQIMSSEMHGDLNHDMHGHMPNMNDNMYRKIPEK